MGLRRRNKESMLYFDNASTTYVYPEVMGAIYNAIDKHWGNPANLYSFGIESAQMVEEARKKIAKAIGALPEEIIFTSCASESNAIAIKQRQGCFCSPYEHHDIKENNKTKVVDEEYLQRIENVANATEWKDLPYCKYLYAHMLVNNETGELFNLKKKIEIAHKVNMWVLVDATQALGNVPLNVHDLDAEFVSFSFHKVHAPKGIGALYIKKEIQDQIDPLIYGSQEFGLRGGTSNVPYIVGAGIAVEKAVSELEEKKNHSAILRQTIIDGLVNNCVPFRINQGSTNIPSILNISFAGITGDAMMMALDSKGVCVSTGSACNSGDLKPSEVLTEMKVPEEYIQGAIRISMSLENSVQDAETLVDKIAECYQELAI